jgi:hypothetical protein
MSQADMDAGAWAEAMAENDSELCEHAGHEWADAGGGLLVCIVCLTEKRDDEATA